MGSFVSFPKSHELYLRVRATVLSDLAQYPPVVMQVWCKLIQLMNAQNRVYGSQTDLMEQCGITNKMQWSRAKKVLLSPFDPYLIQCDGFMFLCPYDATKTDAASVQSMMNQWHNKLNPVRDKAIKAIKSGEVIDEQPF